MTALVSLVGFVYRCMTLLSLRIRCQSLGLDSQGTSVVKQVLKKLTTTDFILLGLLRQNLDQITFDKLIYSVDERL